MLPVRRPRASVARLGRFAVSAAAAFVAVLALVVLAEGAAGCAATTSDDARNGRSAFPESRLQNGSGNDMRGGGDMPGKGRGGEHKLGRMR
jgi:hypothetical protein